MTNATDNANRLIITASPKDSDRHAFARFTWSEDVQDCDMVAVGLTDEELDTLLENKVHEGCALDGWTVEIA